MHQQMQSFRIGDRVSLRPPGYDPKTGIIAKCNRKTVTLMADDAHQGNVAPMFLSRVIAEDSTPQTGQPQIIQLPTKR